MSVKIYSQNVNGMRDFVKRRKIFSYFKQKKVDILCLQEMHSQLEDEKFWSNEWNGRVIFSHGANNSRGVAVFLRKDLNCNINQIIKDVYGRYIILVLGIDDQEFVLTNVYGPNQDNPEFHALESIRENGKPKMVISRRL